MFWGKKKTQLEKMIDENGIDFATAQLAMLISEKIPTLRVARQFILEELDAARQGNDLAQHFVKNSGFDESDYKGAMNRSFEDVDGPNGPQQLILHILTSQLGHDMELMVNVRCKTVEQIMKKWNLGSYALDESSENGMDWFAFDNSANVLSATKGQSQLITLLTVLEMILKDQMWHVQKIDYAQKHSNGVLYAIVAQGYLKFNGPDKEEAIAVEASECTLGIIENDLDVLPTVLVQFCFNFYEHDIKVEVELFDSRPYGGYHAIQGLSMMINFTRDEFLESFANVNPDSELEQLLKTQKLFESTTLLSRTFRDGLADFADHLPEIMERVKKITLEAILSA